MIADKNLLILEYCPHGDLFDLILNFKELLLSERMLVKNLFRQICLAVHLLHCETGHAHLDLKTDNLLIGTDFKLKLCDLGQA